MVPNSYQTREIFEDTKANQICDMLFTKLVEQFPPNISDVDNDTIYKGIILSGRAAAIYQGEPNIDLVNIVFQTYQEEVYQYLQKALGNIFNCQVMCFKERILWYPYGYYFEIWWSEAPLQEQLVNGIYMQNLLSIPTETL